MTENKKSIKQIIIILIPFILAALILLPRLISPQFGFFDDANSLSQSQRFLSGDFSMSHDKQAGRFRPIYWLYFATIYALAGYHPFWFFLGNLFLLFILLIEIRLLIKRMGGSEWQILLTSILFVLSMPIIENFYTLSKGEPLQLAFLLAAVITLTPKREPKQNIPWAAGLLSTLFILLAIMVKETAIVMIPVTFLWVAFLFFTKDENLRKERKQYWFILGTSVLAVVIYFGIRTVWGATSLLGGTYTDRYLVDIGAMLDKLLRWITQFAFYFHYMVPFALLLIVLLLVKTPLTKKESFNLYRWGIWWALWFLILIPWQYAELYYLLPFAFGGVMLIGLIAPNILSALKSEKLFTRIISWILAVLVVVLFILTLPNYLTDANTQLTFDRVNNQMLTYIVNQTSKNSTIFVNIQTSNEYSEKLEVMLRQHYHLTDITYNHIGNELMDTITENPGALILMPFIKNQPRLTVRAGVEEAYQDQWNQVFFTETEGQRQSLQTFESSFRLTNVNLPVLICPILGDRGFCQEPEPLIDSRILTYGWEIFQIK
jgi:hypothetical protein